MQRGVNVTLSRGIPEGGVGRCHALDSVPCPVTRGTAARHEHEHGHGHGTGTGTGTGLPLGIAKLVGRKATRPQVGSPR